MRGWLSRKLWITLLAASVAGVGAIDLFFLARSKAFLGSGFNSEALGGPADMVGFVVVAAVCDTALLLGLWALMRPPVRLLGLSPLRELLVVAGLSVFVPVIVNSILTRLHMILGDLIALESLFSLSGGDALGAAEEALATTALSLLLLIFAVALALLWLLTGWLERVLDSGSTGPTTRRGLTLFILSALAGVAVLLACERSAPNLAFGLRWKASGMALGGLGKELTDVDRDGLGLLSRPADFAPFDSERHAYATDHPGNGMDENGLGGDLPLGADSPRPVQGPALRAGGPSLILILLETFREDLLDLDFGDQPVAPNLRALAAEGASSRAAFAHTPMTWTSRGQLLQGRLVPAPGHPTLIDDFRAIGYQVAWISGQHDGLEGGEGLGLSGAHFFRDARDHIELRTTPSKRPISLQVSWQTVVADTEAFLKTRGTDRPLFLCINVVDTHFPYDHDQLEDILPVERITRADIRRSDARRVWEAYLNSVANVDRAVGRILAAAEAALGDDFAVVVTADHGEAFYEEGFLGHGQALDVAQSGIPLIVKGIQGTWPEPIGLADLRGLIARDLPHARPGGGPRFLSDPGRRLFQYMGSVEHPHRIALRWEGRVATHELADPPPREPSPDFDELIHAWESVRAGGDTGR
ncbi:MAG: hypothetical protein CL878_04385 [Dehalococcoidia bacterium]|nr:hypothetical protein [Dehalococcoidia bacterium]